ncbi:meiosis 1 arrest protein [Trichonephila clavata]|uniref:Meiosis 1 arrest protein n=1 Tax=Trichonephila clavata TaxID=2740835 RepID=A0A8X6H5K9_TRICU|nr:meiosis 1 arrest protein [Trichonephila clavata]
MLVKCRFALNCISVFFFFPNTNLSQPTARVNPSSKQLCVGKVPVYTLEAISVVKKEGLCESLLFGHPFVASATRCWKLDWDELERNQQQFIALVQHLSKNNLVLLTKRQSSQSTSSEKSLPSGFFAFFPSQNTLLVKSVASKELVMPLGEMEVKEIPEEIELEIGECLKSLGEKNIYNPLTVSSGLYTFLSSTINKMNRSRPSTNFTAPTRNKDNDLRNKKKCAVLPVDERQKNKSKEPMFQRNFMTASAMIKKRFPNNLE